MRSDIRNMVFSQLDPGRISEGLYTPGRIFFRIVHEWSSKRRAGKDGSLPKCFFLLGLLEDMSDEEKMGCREETFC